MSDQAVRSVESYYRPVEHIDFSPIVYVNNSNRKFKVRPEFISILPSFRGTESEEPYDHLTEFVEICAINQVSGFTDDEVKLRLFTYSLKEKAKKWFLSLPHLSINTWAEMKKQFLEEFYPINKTFDIRKQIQLFRQLPNELFHEVFERFKDLLRSCPHHEIPLWELVKIFYCSLNFSNKQLLIAASGGEFLTRTSDEEWTLIEKLSKGSKTLASIDQNSQNSIQVHNVFKSGNDKNTILQVKNVCEKRNELDHFTISCPKQKPQVMEKQVLKSLTLSSNEKSKYIPPHLRKKHFDVNSRKSGVIFDKNESPIDLVKIISEKPKLSSLKKEDNKSFMKFQPSGVNSHDIYSAQVVDNFTNDDSDNDELESVSELIVKDKKDNEDLDKQLRDLIGDDFEEVLDHNFGDITSDELDKLLEMNNDEFTQLYKNTPTDLESKKIQGEFLLSFVMLSLLYVQNQIISNIIVLSKTIQAYTEFVNEKRKLEGALATFLTEKHSIFEENVFVKIDFKSTDFSNNHFLSQNRKFKRLVYSLFCSPICNVILNHFWFKHFVNNRKHNCCPRLNSSVGEESLDPDE